MFQGQKESSYFDINNLEANIHYHTPHIFKSGGIILLIPFYTHVILASELSDRNRELTIGPEDRAYESTLPRQPL